MSSIACSVRRALRRIQRFLSAMPSYFVSQCVLTRGASSAKVPPVVERCADEAHSCQDAVGIWKVVVLQCFGCVFFSGVIRLDGGWLESTVGVHVVVMCLFGFSYATPHDVCRLPVVIPISVFELYQCGLRWDLRFVTRKLQFLR